MIGIASPGLAGARRTPEGSAQSIVDETHRDERGFTLVELMIALTLFSFAVAGVLSVAVTITQGFREQRQAINAEAAVRAPIDFLADALRQASPGVPDPSKVIDYHTCGSGAITVTNSGSASDELDLVYASGGVVTTLTGDFTSSSSALAVYDATQIAPGDYVLVTNLTDGFVMKVDSKSGSNLAISGKCTSPGLTFPAAGFPKGSLVVRAQHAHFAIDSIKFGGVPTLTMDIDGSGSATADPEPLAENIEDMQIAVGVDTDALNGISELGGSANDDEWHYNASGDSAPSAAIAIRGVRVTLIARTASTLFGNVSTGFNRPKAEDHAAGSSDNYRRRTLRTLVELRNIGGSP